MAGERADEEGELAKRERMIAKESRIFLGSLSPSNSAGTPSMISFQIGNRYERYGSLRRMRRRLRNPWRIGCDLPSKRSERIERTICNEEEMRGKREVMNEPEEDKISRESTNLNGSIGRHLKVGKEGSDSHNYLLNTGKIFHSLHIKCQKILHGFRRQRERRDREKDLRDRVKTQREEWCVCVCVCRRHHLGE